MPLLPYSQNALIHVSAYAPNFLMRAHDALRACFIYAGHSSVRDDSRRRRYATASFGMEARGYSGSTLLQHHLPGLWSHACIVGRHALYCAAFPLCTPLSCDITFRIYYALRCHDIYYQVIRPLIPPERHAMLLSWTLLLSTTISTTGRY